MSRYASETVTFSDGVFDIYSCDKYGRKDKLISKGHRFGRKVLGSQRYFAAAAARVKVTDLICVQAGVEIAESNIIVIAGEDYKIKQIQPIPDGKPAHKLLTLNKERS